MKHVVKLCTNCNHPLDGPRHAMYVFIKRGNKQIRIKHDEICNCTHPKYDNTVHKCPNCEKVIIGNEEFEAHKIECKKKIEDPYYQDLMKKKWI
jgi:hypothetical protein